MDAGTAAEKEFLLASARAGKNVADLMTKHLAAARVEELLSKARGCYSERGVVCGRIVDLRECRG